MSEVINVEKLFLPTIELGSFTNGTFVFNYSDKIRNLADAKKITKFSIIKGYETYSYEQFWQRINNLEPQNAFEQLQLTAKSGTKETLKKVKFIDNFVFLGE